MNQQNSIAQLATILIVVVALWARAFILPVAMQPCTLFSPLYTPFYNLLGPHPQAASIAALILTIVEGVWINVMLYNYKAITNTSLWPMLIYIVSMSWMPGGLTMTPVLLVNLVVLAACRNLLSDGTSTLSFDRNFNASLCIGIASLIYLPALALILPYIVVFNIYKMYRWRDIVVSLFGIAAPLIVFVTYAYLTDRLDEYIDSIVESISAITLRKDFGSSITTVTNAAFLIAFAALLIRQISTMNDKLISTRINSAILALPALAAIAMALYGSVFPMDTQLLAIPFSFLAANYTTARHKRKWVAPALSCLFIALALVNVYAT